MFAINFGKAHPLVLHTAHNGTGKGIPRAPNGAFIDSAGFAG
jgi:hypothetical protein